MIGVGRTFYLIRRVNSRGDYAENVEATEGIRKFKGVISLIYGQENLTFGRTTVDSTHIIRCDYFTDICEDDKIRLEGRMFNITYIDNCMELNKQMRIFVKEMDTEDATRY